MTSQFDRWYVCAITLATPNGEYGDMFAVEVTRNMTKTFDEFATGGQDDQTG